MIDLIKKIIRYAAFGFLIISCGQGSKTNHDNAMEGQGADEVIEQAAGLSNPGDKLAFEKLMGNAKSKKVPHLEATNFDSFIDEDDYKEIDFKAYKLDQIYPDFDAAGHNYKAIAKFAVPLSDDFHSVVMTVLKSELEMESVLINYDKGGVIIDHQVVSYDEIAEGMSQVVSRISEGNLTVNHIFWSDNKKVEEVTFEILYDGKIEKIETKSLNETFLDFELINSVLTELQLDWVQTKTNLITAKTNPENPEETILVIPKIVDEGVQYFNLDSHIVIADNNTYKIKNTYAESHQTNQWESDAIALNRIEIDETRYRIAGDKSAFGVTVSYRGHSRVNPYSNKTLSLFKKSGNGLVKVLSDFSIENFNGEWDGDCEGSFVNETKAISISNKKTKGYFDILATSRIVESLDHKDLEGDCESSSTTHFKNVLLKFNGKTYLETEIQANFYSEFQPPQLKAIPLEKFDFRKAFELSGLKIVTGHFIPDSGKHFASGTETETDWGDRLLVLDVSNKIVHRSRGFGESYLFEPHFYTSKAAAKTIIICQKAFEYPFGGEVFILENGVVNYIGTLDIEGDDEESYLTEIIEIFEAEGSIYFILKSDQVILRPGSKDQIKTDNNVVYVYEDNRLRLNTKDQ
ncbi:PA3715 family protein [Algoriphagus litoralis]|uniref:hypothetical protein n=1 Tax=Algoriphagus litoralis TaxID=2202829 RepID=UPI000DBAC094|nr:hypothetical protein [Algoriphagus litoralis]